MARRSNKRATTKVFRKRPSRHSLLLGTVLAVFIGLVYHVATRQPQVMPSTVQQELGGVRLEGIGGDADQNRLKNRVTAPTAMEDVSPAAIVALKDGVLLEQGKKWRSKWSADAREYLSKMEQRGMRVSGYLIAAKESGPESCNGNVDSLRDYHIWIGDSATATKLSSVVVEVTPRWKAIHPEWKLQYFNALAHQHAKVRVTGWLLWDEEHANEVDHSRATCWEVHPITKFEIQVAGEWRELTGQYAAR